MRERLEKSILQQRERMRPRIEAVELTAVYELFLDLKLLAELDEKLFAKSNVDFDLPFFSLLQKTSPLFAATWRLALKLGIEIKPAIQSIAHHEDHAQAAGADLVFPDTKKQFYWMLRFPEPPVVFKDFLRIFTFHWPIFGELVRAILIRSYGWDAEKLSKSQREFLEIATAHFESLLFTEAGPVLGPVLEAVRLIAPGVPIDGSVSKELLTKHLPKNFKNSKAFLAWCDSAWTGH